MHPVPELSYPALVSREFANLRMYRGYFGLLLRILRMYRGYFWPTLLLAAGLPGAALPGLLS